MRQLRLMLIPVALLALAGCSKNSTDPTAPAAGQLRVAVTDAPADYDAVNLVVTEVSVNRGSGDSGWEVLSSTTQTVDLLTLQNGVFADLADATVTSGSFAQLRLKLGAGSNVVVDGFTHPLTIPSGMTSGLKINGNFAVPADGEVTVQLDIDAAKSISLVSGEYRMDPVVRMGTANASGAIRGTVVPAGLATSVRVSQGDTEICTNWVNPDGSFKVAVLPPGTYTVRVQNLSGVLQYNDVQVTAGGVYSLGELSFVFDMPTAPMPGEAPSGGTD